MKKLFLLLLMVGFNFTNAQSKSNDKKEILGVLETFAKSMKEKDSVSYLNLFHREPIVWEGVDKDKSLNKYRKERPKEKGYFSDNYRDFIKRIVKSNKIIEEKFDNIQIINDEKIAVVFFDYTYNVDGKITNRGSESWQLVKISGKWKIKSIVFSTESESVEPFPSLKIRKKLRERGYF